MRAITLPAVRRSIEALRGVVGEAAAEAGLGEREAAETMLALEEACSNIIDHAYAGVPAGQIEVACEARAGRLTIRIRDRGRPFDPRSAPAPDLGRDVNGRAVGGLGIHLIRSLMDEVRFEASSGAGNVLTLVKHASAGRRAP